LNLSLTKIEGSFAEVGQMIAGIKFASFFDTIKHDFDYSVLG